MASNAQERNDKPRQAGLTPAQVDNIRRECPLLQSLVALAAGFHPKGSGVPERLRNRPGQARLIYCVKGAGWCDFEGRLGSVRPGDLLVVGPGAVARFGPHASNPWSIHWVQIEGEAVDEYLAVLRGATQEPIARVGENLELARLFNEVLRSLSAGPSVLNVFQASQAAGHLIALAARARSQRSDAAPDAAQKVAQAIIYMSEHLDESPRVTALARLANVSPAHFSVLFKEQTGCSPKEYLHLLRIHQACQMLGDDTHRSVKEIAARLGYQDQFHFSRQFKAFQGLSPSEYRESKVSSS